MSRKENLRNLERALQCDMLILRLLLYQTIARLPEPQRLLRQFEAEVDRLAAALPPGFDPEWAVELRARARHLLTEIKFLPEEN